MINEKIAWCGIDLSKNTLDAGYHPAGHSIEFSTIPATSFPRTQAGMSACYDWIERQRGPHDSVRVIMEATGRYSLETATWILTDHPEYEPAIVNLLRSLPNDIVTSD